MANKTAIGGFTLIEVLMALSILVIGSLIIFHSFRVVTGLSRRYSYDLIQLGDQAMQELLLETDHPRKYILDHAGWRVHSRSEIRNDLLHFFVKVYRNQNSVTPAFDLYTARLPGAYTIID